MEVVLHLQENGGSSSICQKNEIVFHFKHRKPYLTALVYISSHFETIPGGWVAGGGGRELDIRLAQLELGLSLAKRPKTRPRGPGGGANFIFF